MKSPDRPFEPVVGRSIDQLETPALLIEQSTLDRNLSDMQRLADRHGLALRPHIKTHKSPWLASRQIGLGAKGLACAKLSEAEVMIEHGFEDLLVANQIVTPDKATRLAVLNQRAMVTVGVDSAIGVDVLAKSASREGVIIGVLMEIDCGLRRAGLRSTDKAVELAKLIAGQKSLRLAGLFTHAGHAYAARSEEELAIIGRAEGESAVRTARELRAAGFDVPIVSAGSTPTAHFCAAIPGVTELRVGNYVFCDRMQVKLGVADLSQCALTTLTTVTSRPEKDMAIIDAGSKTFTAEQGAHGWSGLDGFGAQVGGPAKVVRLSEEHGFVQLNGADAAIGDQMRFVPNHACAVMNLADRAWLVEGETVVGALEITARGKTS